ncbi:nramp1 [Symbiodinium pilosum]|uniref:Nramp1 protein n=1 Tax=Symbiodinium pilosum TaxID=2952 RepID=A0A812YF16_SYMPI|nr:nramp1 [Symbiodinium pilosum]
MLPELEVFESPLGATLGIRTARTASPGELLGFYPGTIFEATEPQLPKSDKLFANEYNGVYLDGQGWLPLHWRKHALLRDRKCLLFGRGCSLTSSCVKDGDDYTLTPMPGSAYDMASPASPWRHCRTEDHRSRCFTVALDGAKLDLLCESAKRFARAEWPAEKLEYTDSVDSWNVRASPELDAYVLCVLQAGQPFSVLSQQDDWLQIRTENGVKGWSYKKFKDRQVLVPVGHVAQIQTQPDVSSKTSGDLAELMSELGERRRSLSEAPPDDLVRAAHGVQQTMAKLELYGIEQEWWNAVNLVIAGNAMQQHGTFPADLSVELCRSSSYKHSDFQNPQKDSCWLSTFFQSLWHSRVFHALFDSLVRPLPAQGAGSVSDALRETWELYEHRAASGRPVPIQFLVDAWGSGYGDCAEAFAKLQEDPCLKPLAELIASVPVHFTGATLTADDLFKEVQQMGVRDAPLLALDLVLPSMSSGSILSLVLAILPRHSRGKEREERLADLGDSHSLVAMICYIEAFAHYVVFCRRQSDDNCWLFFNDLPGVARGVHKEFYGWAAIAHECARFELRPKVLLYDSAKKAQEAMNSVSPMLRASIQAASAAKQKTSRGLWSLGVCVLMVIIALLLQQLQEIRAILQVSPR